MQAVRPQADVIIEGGVRRHGKLCRFLRPVGTGIGIFQVGPVLGHIGVVADEVMNLLLRGQVEGLDAVELAAPYRFVAIGLVADRYIDVIKLADLAFAVAGPHDRHGNGKVICTESELTALPCHDHVGVGVTVVLADLGLVKADDAVIVYGEGRVGKADMVIGKVVDALRLLPAGQVDGLHVPVRLRQLHGDAVGKVAVLIQNIQDIGGRGRKGEVVNAVPVARRQQRELTVVERGLIFNQLF